MKKGQVNNDKFRVSKLVIIVTFFLFVILIIRICYLCLYNYKVGSITIEEFIKNRNTAYEVIMPKRGTIYDVNGNILASDVVSYNLLAYLSTSRVYPDGKKDYVEDIDDTSQKLASVLHEDADKIKEILVNGKENDKYQVEFGNIGKGITELVKEEIDKLNLQGIDYIPLVKRYYPNGDFASYILGYSVFKEDDEGNQWLTGEMGIEEYFNDQLKGRAGYTTYEKDRSGYRILNGREYVEPADDGNDVYLTIDDNIQLFIENAVKDASERSSSQWVLMAAMDAKSGAILGYASTPSFDPNLRNMTSYIDPIATLTYEPGSTMKVFSYMCAIDSGKYNGSDTYESGTKTYTSELDDSTVTIADWNRNGWGRISYDKGFALSSNIAVANLVESVITKEELKACYTKYGFGKITGFTLKREEAGSIDYKYQIEAATAGYGQGITTTALQHLQGLTIIANNGEMIKPYIVDKIVDTDTGKVVYEGKRESLGKVVKEETTVKMKELMASVINGDNTNSTGYLYHMDGYSLIGKTGTAQIFDYQKGKYMTGSSDYVYSFSGMFPEEDPEIILYAALKIPKDTTNYIAPMIKEVEKNITKYLNIESNDKESGIYEIPSLYNKKVEEVKNDLLNKGLRVVTIGTGDKITDYYPSMGSNVSEGDLVILKTNNKDIKMINFLNYSKKEALNILKLMGFEYETYGDGYVYEQNIKEGEDIKEKIILKFNNRYEETE